MKIMALHKGLCSYFGETAFGNSSNQFTRKLLNHNLCERHREKSPLVLR